MSTAVHVADAFGFQWGYIIPEHILSESISEEEIRRLELDIDALVFRIKRERDMALRFSLFIELFQEIADKSGSQSEFCANTIEFLEKTMSLTSVDSMKLVKPAYQLILDFNEIYFHRMIVLGLKGSFATTREWLESDNAQFEWGVTIFEEFDFSLGGEQFTNIVFNFAEKRAEESMRIMNRNCSSISEIDFNDATWERTIDNQLVIETAVAVYQMGQIEVIFALLRENR